MNSASKALFEPVFLLGRTVRNRIAMPAVHLGMAQEGAPTEDLLRFYESVARGGVAMITVGVCNTWQESRATGLHGDLDLSTESTLGPFERLTRKVKDAGAAIGVQLSPLKGYNNPAWWPTPQQLGSILQSFGQASARARKVGFDYVELMLSGGSLLSHFASPVFNTGAIASYSGDFDGRARLALEAVDAIRDATSGAMPIAARLHSHELLQGGYDSTGAIELARALTKSGVEAISVTGAGHRTPVPQLLPETPANAFAYLARPIAMAIDRPVLCGGRIRTEEEAAQALLVSGAAMVNLARALLVDPEWPLKVQSGQGSKIVPCMACGVCLDKVFAKQAARCPLNPDLGRTTLPPLPQGVEPLLPGSKILIVGSGPAGLRASATLANAGHEVELVEQAARLGGRWNVASEVHGRGDLRLGLESMVCSVRDAGVRIRLGQSLHPDQARQAGADALVIATGSTPRRPAIPGLELHPKTVYAEQAILNPTLAGRDTVILGAGGVGVEVALHLARQYEPPDEVLGYIARKSGDLHMEGLRRLGSGRRITLVRRRGYAGKGLGPSLRWALLDDLKRLGVRIVDKCAYEKVTEQGVVIAVGPSQEKKLLEADTLIIAAGQVAPSQPLDEWRGSAPRLLLAGDATGAVGNLADAILGAHELCLALCSPGRS
jgi:2,4-dienoyl-CoA reductase (NADPH2)